MSRQLFVAEPATSYSRLPPIIVDCSVLAAILFNEPSRDEALALLSGKSLHAPNLIDHEVISVAIKKSAAKAGDLVQRGMESYARLRLARHTADPQAQLELALTQKISAYDAAYLQVAIALNAPLATYDRALAIAARNVL